MGISVDESVPDDLALIVRTPKGCLLPYPEGENVLRFDSEMKNGT